MPAYTPAQFDKAVQLIGALPKDGPVTPTQADQLKFYGLFKQANEGDNTKPKPGMMDFAGKAKWAAWNENKGLDKDEAKSQYVAHFIQVLETANNDDATKLKAEVLGA
ncbi:acyl-CoA-binding protein (ACBP)/diazepam binding inhibitor (DBI)/endozepine (EP) [Rhodotorula kratochvilovae]